MSESTTLKIYACQTDIFWEDKAANFAHVRELIRNARPEPGGLIVLPEMFATGFSMSGSVIAEKASTGETTTFLSELACLYRCHVLAGVITNDRPTGRPHNEAIILGPTGAIVGRYAKQRPFTPSGERDTYAAGACPVVVDVNGLRVAPLICYDLRFPELFRDALTLDVDAYVVIASWPGARIRHWSTLLHARAIENQAYVIGVNRVGADPTPLSYPGKSAIIDPSGSVLAAASDEETVIEATIDLAFVSQYRNDLPFLKDR
jgi:predicted amidohydrolase